MLTIVQNGNSTKQRFRRENAKGGAGLFFLENLNWCENIKRWSLKRTGSSVSSRPFLSRALKKLQSSSVSTGLHSYLHYSYTCICICIVICICQFLSPISLSEWTSSAISRTQRLTPQQRRTSALRTTRRSASSNTPRPGQNIFEHTQVQKKLSSNERHSHFGFSICPYHNNGDFSVEETIEKCYHPMERLCAPPAYGEEPAEVFNLTLLDFFWKIFSAFLAIYFLHVMVMSVDIFGGQM